MLATCLNNQWRNWNSRFFCPYNPSTYTHVQVQEVSAYQNLILATDRRFEGILHYDTALQIIGSRSQGAKRSLSRSVLNEDLDMTVAASCIVDPLPVGKNNSTSFHLCCNAASQLGQDMPRLLRFSESSKKQVSSKWLDALGQHLMTPPAPVASCSARKSPSHWRNASSRASAPAARAWWLMSAAMAGLVMSSVLPWPVNPKDPTKVTFLPQFSPPPVHPGICFPAGRWCL